MVGFKTIYDMQEAQIHLFQTFIDDCMKSLNMKKRLFNTFLTLSLERKLFMASLEFKFTIKFVLEQRSLWVKKHDI